MEELNNDKLNEDKNNIQTINTKIDTSKDLIEKVREYNILVNDLKIEEIDVKEMTNVFLENLKLINEIDDNIMELDRINKKLNMHKLEERLKNDDEMVKEEKKVEE